MTSSRGEAALTLRPDGVAAGERTIAAEAPVAIEVDGLGYAVMMATPADLIDFACGFALSERLIDGPGELIAAEPHDGGMGIMGNGTFSNMMAYGEEDWRRIREQIEATNASDKAKRS